ncbi:MAG TPA: ribulokinase [Bacteroidota bacterium]|nr:ribulokinase [Bacteroidota bacterium]
MKKSSFVIGADFGTDSVRILIVDAATGREISSAVANYRRWGKGLFCDPAANQFRQHPLDYIEAFQEAVQASLKRAPKGTAGRISALSVDTTGSTPCAVDEHGTPLALLKGFESNPNAMFVLWKDHTAVREAGEINKLAKSWGGEDFTKFEGGVYSSEWFWAKILHVLRADASVRKTAYSWVEHCDWFPALLTGSNDVSQMKRSRCAAGHKAMWHTSFNGLPSEEFLVALDPLLKGLRRRLFEETYTSDVVVGTLSAAWAKKLGLPPEVKVGVGAFDAHMGAIGGEIVPYHLTKIMGTSTCDMLVAPNAEIGDKLVRGICGQVDGSIIPGMLGMEAGQSAFGDVYAWFKDVLMWPAENIISKSRLLTPRVKQKLMEELADNLIAKLSAAAEKIPIDESGLLALDWMNGRRTPDANQLLKGAITGINLGSDAPRIFRSLVEATAFGAKKIVERFRSEGIRIDGVIAFGGVAKKSRFIMQVVSDVLDMSIRIPRSEQTCALGAAMCAATVAGLYPTIEDAKKNMGQGFEKEYKPNPDNARKYRTVFARYAKLGDFVERELTERGPKP